MLIRKMKLEVRSIILSILLLTLTSCMGLLLKKLKMQDTDIIIVYLTGVLLTARLTTGYFYGIMVSFISMFTFNYLFIEPQYHFDMGNTQYLYLLLYMIIAAIMISMMTSQMKSTMNKLMIKEADSRELYQLSHSLIEAQSQEEIVNAAIKRIGQLLSSEVLWQNYREHKPEDDRDSRYTFRKINGTCEQYGYVRIENNIVEKLSDSRKERLNVMLENFAMAIDRMSQMEQRRKLDEKVVQERYRSDLLRSISHDIRTPLAGIIGNSEMLLDMTDREDFKYPLEKQIRGDAQWLCSLVENILNLTRMQEGLVLKKEYEALEEIVESAIRRMGGVAPDFEITAQMPEEMLLVSMDAKLIQQVIMNLLDNAVKHTEKGNEIQVTVKVLKNKGEVCVSVKDRGNGIPEKILENIFEPFYTADNVRRDIRKGIGLGLSICRTIITAHGGQIAVGNRTDGVGAQASFTLPLEEKKDEKKSDDHSNCGG